jgi:hypothetical protein
MFIPLGFKFTKPNNKLSSEEELVEYPRVFVLIAALNEEQGIERTLLELKKTLAEPALSAHVSEFMCDSQVMLHLNCSLEEGF